MMASAITVHSAVASLDSETYLRASKKIVPRNLQAQTTEEVVVVNDTTSSKCSEEWKAANCDLYCNTDFLKDKCCMYHDQTASMLTIEFPHNLAIYARKDMFEDCTGANLAFTPYQVQGTGAFRPLFEVGEGAREDATSAGVYDSYMTQAMSVYTFADEVEDLSPRVAATPEMKWTDILPVVRRMGATTEKQISVPFDLDFVSLLLRDDLRDAYEKETGSKTPRTWEEFADYTEYWHGKDLNGDGEPDFGICSLNGAGPGGPQAMLMAIAASKLQYQGSMTGTWFDLDNPDAVPLFENEAFYQAAELTRRLWMHSIDDQPGGWVELHEDYWHNGRCASYMWLTGSVALVLTKNRIRRCASYPVPCGENDEVLWEPTREDGSYWEPRRFRSMGSAQVYDRTDGKMKTCTPEANPKGNEVMCPYLDAEEDERDGVWINRAPYFYSAYQHSSISIRDGADPAAKDLLWDFIVMANLEAAPVVAQDLGPTYLDPFRRSHLTPETRGLYDSMWSDQMYDDLRKEFLYAGSSPNSALPLSIPGVEEYELQMEMTLWQYFLDVGLDCTSKDDCKCRKYKNQDTDICGYGWGFDPDEELWARSRKNGGSLNTKEFASSLKQRWDAITAKNGGGRAQINRYRATLGQDPLPTEEGNTWAIPLVIGLASFVGFCLVLAGIGWIYVTYREKKRLQRAHEFQMESTLNEATRAMSSLDYPLQLVRGDEFVAEGTLRRHELLRNQHKLTVLDSLSDVDAFVNAGKHIIFFSHQWTSFTSPDHSGKQFEMMATSLKELAEQNGWDASLKDTFVWVDYSCIPQANPSTQTLAVRSLAAYSSSATYFIIVSPTVTHGDLDDEICNLETYQTRMWCRAEQVCHTMRNGLDGMFVATGSGLEPVQPDFFKDSLLVFEGELTCCRLEHKGFHMCDRQALVIPLLGLYGELYRTAYEAKKDGKNSDQIESVQNYLHQIETQQERVFPRTFMHTSWRNNKRTVEELTLFGDLIERMKARVESGTDYVELVDDGKGTASTASLVHGGSALVHGGSALVHGGSTLVHGASSVVPVGIPRGDSVKPSGFIRHGSSVGAGSATSTGSTGSVEMAVPMTEDKEQAP